MSTTGTPADLEERLARMDARIGALEAELAYRCATVPAPYPRPGQWAPPVPPVPAGGPGRPPGPPAPRRQADWSRLPVWAGAAVTFVGVVLLLVLAASADWFGPAARVLAGAGLGVALLVVAGWLVRRSGRSGAGPSALAGTGATALLGSVVAATTLYELVPAPVGLVLCLVVAAAGIALADRWDSSGFALAVLIGVEIALLAVAGDLDPLSLGMAVVVQVGVAPTALRRAPALAPVAAAGTALHGLLAGPLAAFEPEDVDAPGLLLAVGTLALVVGVAVAVLGALRGARGSAAGGAGGVGRTRGSAAGGAGGVGRTRGSAAGGAGGVGRTRGSAAGGAGGVGRTRGSAAGGAGGVGRTRGSAAGGAGGVGRTTQPPSVLGIAAAPVPLLAALPAVGTAVAVTTALAAAAVTAAAAYPRTGRGVRVAALSVAALLVAAATARGLDGVTLAAVLLAEALVLLGPAAWLRSRPAQLAGAWLAVVGGTAALGTALDPESVVEPLIDPAADLPAGALLVAALLTVVAVVALVAALRTGTPSSVHWAAWAWLPIAAGLYGASWLVVAGAQLVAPGENGFLTGHVLVTLGVTGLGVALLVHGLHRRVTGRAGFALIAAALLKLVLFDLVTLDGLARVAAFIGAGLVLLAVGTWYARKASPAGGSTPATAGEGS